MDFKELSYIIAIAEHQSITKAANSLYLSQPTLTIFLQNLEKKTGQKLFQRSGNKMIPTYAGKCYLEKAYEIMHIKKELDKTMQMIQQEDTGILKIACPPILGSSMLPDTLSRFRERYPKVKIQIVENTTDEIKKLLLEGSIDLAFLHSPFKTSQIKEEIICHDEVLLAVSPQHPIQKKAIQKEGFSHPWIDISEFAQQDFIVSAFGQRTRQLSDLMFKQYDIHPKNLLETSNLHTSIALIARNFGVAFLIDFYLKYIPFQDEVTGYSFGLEPFYSDFLVAYSKNHIQNSYTKEYIQIVKEWHNNFCEN